MDPYTIMHDRSRFVDQQSIKLQEAPDVVPVGELPRHMQLSAERYASLNPTLLSSSSSRNGRADWVSLRSRRLVFVFLRSRYLTGKVVPGSRVIVTGIYSTYQSKKAVSNSSLPPSSALPRLSSLELTLPPPLPSFSFAARIRLSSRSPNPLPSSPRSRTRHFSRYVAWISWVHRRGGGGVWRDQSERRLVREVL